MAGSASRRRSPPPPRVPPPGEPWPPPYRAKSPVWVSHFVNSNSSRMGGRTRQERGGWGAQGVAERGRVGPGGGRCGEGQTPMSGGLWAGQPCAACVPAWQSARQLHLVLCAAWDW